MVATELVVMINEFGLIAQAARVYCTLCYHHGVILVADAANTCRYLAFDDVMSCVQT